LVLVLVNKDRTSKWLHQVGLFFSLGSFFLQFGFRNLFDGINYILGRRN